MDRFGTMPVPTDTGGTTLIAPTAAMWLAACNALHGPAGGCTAWRWNGTGLGCFTALLGDVSSLRITLAPCMHLPTRGDKPYLDPQLHAIWPVACNAPVQWLRCLVGAWHWAGPFYGVAGGVSPLWVALAPCMHLPTRGSNPSRTHPKNMAYACLTMLPIAANLQQFTPLQKQQQQHRVM